MMIRLTASRTPSLIMSLVLMSLLATVELASDNSVAAGQSLSTERQRKS